MAGLHGKATVSQLMGTSEICFFGIQGDFFFFLFKSVAWLRRVWKHVPNVSSFFTPGNLTSTLGSHKLKPISQPNCHSFSPPPVCNCGVLWAFVWKWKILFARILFKKQQPRKHLENVTTWSRTALSSIPGPWCGVTLRIIHNLSLGERQDFHLALGRTLVPHRYGDSLYRAFQSRASSQGCDVGKGACSFSLFNFLLWGVSPAAPLRERKKIWHNLNFAHIYSSTGRSGYRWGVLKSLNIPIKQCHIFL